MTGTVEVIIQEYKNLKNEILEELTKISNALGSLQERLGGSEDEAAAQQVWKLEELDRQYGNVLNRVNGRLLELTSGLKLNANPGAYLNTALISPAVCRACGADSNNLIGSLGVIKEGFTKDPRSLQAQAAVALGFYGREKGTIRGLRDSIRNMQIARENGGEGDMLGKRNQGHL